MMTSREYQELVARCVSIVVFYRTSDQTSTTSARLSSEIHGVASAIDRMSPPGEDPLRIERPVEGELLARYGLKSGKKAFADFQKAFRSWKPSPI